MSGLQTALDNIYIETGQCNSNKAQKWLKWPI
jgi:hypothetical protein